MQIEHGEITTKKITKNVWIAKTVVTKPFKADVEMKGCSEIEAIEKLKKFFGEN
jgi:hypothetical protein